MSAQDALTLVEMPIEPITRVQRERNAGVLPRRFDGSGVQQGLDEGPQLSGAETTPRDAIAQANARCAAATPATRTFLAADAPGADAAFLWRMAPPNIAMADQRPRRPAERTTQKRKAAKKTFYLRLRPEEHVHPRRVRAAPSTARAKTTGLNSTERDKHPKTALRRRHLPEFPPLPLHPQFGSKNDGTTRQPREVTLTPYAVPKL
jgi:hypothetical protein